MRSNKLFNIALGALLVSVSTVVYGQSNTRGSVAGDTTLNRLVNHAGDNTTSPTHRMLLIPFYSNMCMSEIDKDVNKATNLEYKQITEAFRKGLDLAMYNSIKENYAVISLLQGKNKSDSTLNYIYGSTSYKYDLVPGTVADVGAPTSDSAKKKHYIHNGELQVPVDYSSRFMNVSVQNPKLIPYLNKKYQTDTYVFINELDIKNVDNPTQNLTDDTYQRQATVHYSILDKDGHYVAKGIAVTHFPYKENVPSDIAQKYFGHIAHSILKDYAQELTINKVGDQQKKQASQPKTMLDTH
jgi:hypothetical protein